MTGPPASHDTENQSPPIWHTLTDTQVGQTLQTSAAGLSAAEASRRLDEYGPNRLAPPKRRGPLMRLLLQFHNILLYIILGSSIVSAILGHWVDAAVLLVAVVINAVIGFIQEGKAEAAIDAIRAMLAPLAFVIRDGQRHEIAAADLVPGDVVALASGTGCPPICA